MLDLEATVRVVEGDSETVQEEGAIRLLRRPDWMGGAWRWTEDDVAAGSRPLNATRRGTSLGCSIG